MKTPFFSDADVEQIVAAIRAAEQKTSGEIRVHVENRCWRDPLQRAADVFAALGMGATELHNGILIYLAVKSHKFAIFADRGINAKVPQAEWNALRDRLAGRFRQGDFCDGLCAAISAIGDTLQAHFPRAAGDRNELSDEISFGEG